MVFVVYKFIILVSRAFTGPFMVLLIVIILEVQTLILLHFVLLLVPLVVFVPVVMFVSQFLRVNLLVIIDFRIKLILELLKGVSFTYLYDSFNNFNENI